MSDSPHPKATYFPNLDGWRFVAFFCVFLYHGFHTEFEHIKQDPVHQAIKGAFRNGNLGVDFFFVLSGFLIIYLLISEKHITGRIDARNFYIRRILRIFPLYYLCVFFGFVVFPQLKMILGGEVNENANLLYYLTFLSNLDIVNNNALPDAGVLTVLWSVSVEEQFYLTVPWILIAIPVKWYKWLFGAVIVITWVYRSMHLGEDIPLAIHTLSFTANFAIGGLAAIYSAMGGRFVRYFEELNPALIAMVYSAVIAIFFLRQDIFAHPWTRVFDTTIIALLFAAVILEQNLAKRSLFKMKNNRVFSGLGKYTYGLYCLHMVAALVVLRSMAILHFNTSLWQIVLVEMPLMLLVSVAMAYVSYHYFEKPFLLLKRRFSLLGKERAATP